MPTLLPQAYPIATGTDLRAPPPNYLRQRLPDGSIAPPAMVHPPSALTTAPRRVSGGVSDDGEEHARFAALAPYVGGVDFIASSRDMARLFALPLHTDAVSMTLHRVGGRTLLLESTDAASLVAASSAARIGLIDTVDRSALELACGVDADALVSTHGSAGADRLVPAEVDSLIHRRELASKFLYRSVLPDNEAVAIPPPSRSQMAENGVVSDESLLTRHSSTSPVCDGPGAGIVDAAHVSTHCDTHVDSVETTPTWGEVNLDRRFVMTVSMPRVARPVSPGRRGDARATGTAAEGQAPHGPDSAHTIDDGGDELGDVPLLPSSRVIVSPAYIESRVSVLSALGSGAVSAPTASAVTTRSGDPAATSKSAPLSWASRVGTSQMASKGTASQSPSGGAAIALPINATAQAVAVAAAEARASSETSAAVVSSARHGSKAVPTRSTVNSDISVVAPTPAAVNSRATTPSSVAALTSSVESLQKTQRQMQQRQVARSPVLSAKAPLPLRQSKPEQVAPPPTPLMQVSASLGLDGWSLGGKQQLPRSQSQSRAPEASSSARSARVSSDAATTSYRRALYWNLAGNTMVLGSDALVFRHNIATPPRDLVGGSDVGTPKTADARPGATSSTHGSHDGSAPHPTSQQRLVSLQLRPATHRFSQAEALELYLENRLGGIDDLAVCYHHNGVVAGYDLLATAEIPMLPVPPLSAARIEGDAIALLRFLRDATSTAAASADSSATTAATSFWLHRPQGASTLQLVALTAAEEAAAARQANATKPASSDSEASPQLATSPLRERLASLCLDLANGVALCAPLLAAAREAAHAASPEVVSASTPSQSVQHDVNTLASSVVSTNRLPITSLSQGTPSGVTTADAEYIAVAQRQAREADEADARAAAPASAIALRRLLLEQATALLDESAGVIAPPAVSSDAGDFIQVTTTPVSQHHLHRKVRGQQTARDDNRGRRLKGAVPKAPLSVVRSHTDPVDHPPPPAQQTQFPSQAPRQPLLLPLAYAELAETHLDGMRGATSSTRHDVAQLIAANNAARAAICGLRVMQRYTSTKSNSPSASQALALETAATVATAESSDTLLLRLRAILGAATAILVTAAATDSLETHYAASTSITVSQGVSAVRGAAHTKTRERKSTSEHGSPVKASPLGLVANCLGVLAEAPTAHASHSATEAGLAFVDASILATAIGNAAMGLLHNSAETRQSRSSQGHGDDVGLLLADDAVWSFIREAARAGELQWSTPPPVPSPSTQSAGTRASASMVEPMHAAQLPLERAPLGNVLGNTMGSAQAHPSLASQSHHDRAIAFAGVAVAAYEGAVVWADKSADATHFRVSILRRLGDALNTLGQLRLVASQSAGTPLAASSTPDAALAIAAFSRAVDRFDAAQDACNSALAMLNVAHVLRCLGHSAATVTDHPGSVINSPKVSIFDVTVVASKSANGDNKVAASCASPMDVAVSGFDADEPSITFAYPTSIARCTRFDHSQSLVLLIKALNLSRDALRKVSAAASAASQGNGAEQDIQSTSAQPETTESSLSDNDVTRKGVVTRALEAVGASAVLAGVALSRSVTTVAATATSITGTSPSAACAADVVDTTQLHSSDVEIVRGLDAASALFLEAARAYRAGGGEHLAAGAELQLAMHLSRLLAADAMASVPSPNSAALSNSTSDNISAVMLSARISGSLRLANAAVYFAASAYKAYGKRVVEEVARSDKIANVASTELAHALSSAAAAWRAQVQCAVEVASIVANDAATRADVRAFRQRLALLQFVELSCGQIGRASHRALISGYGKQRSPATHGVVDTHCENAWTKAQTDVIDGSDAFRDAMCRIVLQALREAAATASAASTASPAVVPPSRDDSIAAPAPSAIADTLKPVAMPYSLSEATLRSAYRATLYQNELPVVGASSDARLPGSGRETRCPADVVVIQLQALDQALATVASLVHSNSDGAVH